MLKFIRLSSICRGLQFILCRVIFRISWNKELKSIDNWLSCNKLSLNFDKTSFVIFHPSQKKFTKSISLLLNNNSIEQKDYVKYLGVFIDSHLKFKEHIHQLSKKISRGIGILAKLRPFVSQDILIQFYYSLFYSFLTYGLIVWGNSYMKPPYSYILLLFCRRKLFELLLFLVIMIILLLFSNTCTLWNFVMLYIILIVSLCLNFIIICYLLLFTIFYSYIKRTQV